MNETVVVVIVLVVVESRTGNGTEFGTENGIYRVEVDN
jgi:hypothetical protein